MNLFIALCFALAASLGTVKGDPVDGQVRLNNKGDTDTNAGVVEVYYNGKWGLVCDDGYWSILAASIACRQAGFPAAINVDNYAKYYDPNLDPQQPFWLNDVFCNGDEQTLSECVERLPSSPVSCPIDYAAAVICSDVRLVDTSDNGHDGRVEIYNKGQWHGICGTRWSSEEARVVCNMVFPFETTSSSVRSVQYTSEALAFPIVRCYDFGIFSYGCKALYDTLVTCDTRAAVSCVSDDKKEMDVSDDLRLRAAWFLLELLQETKK